MATLRSALATRMGRRLAAALCAVSLVPALAVLVFPVPVAAAIGAIAGACATIVLLRRYVAPLAPLRDALRSLRDERFEIIIPRAADDIGTLIETANAGIAHVAERMRSLETLSEVDRLLLSSADLEQTLDAVLARVQAVMRCQGVGITLIDADTQAHGRVYAATATTADLPVERVELDPDMLATLERGAGLTIARCERDRHNFLLPLQQLGASFFWVWPVLVGARLVAVLATGYREAPHANPRLARYGGEFAARLAIALTNSAREERLYRQAHYDPLTSLPNRALFRERLAEELSSATATGTRGALLYIDLDHFKHVNDTVGHAAGDQLLTIIAQRLRACVKEGDTVARLAGDEFTIVMRQGADAEAAKAVADRVIASVELPVHVAGRDHSVHASIGMTVFPDDGVTIDELMRNADVAMYRAKELGRGRAVLFDRVRASRQTPLSGSGLFRALRHREFALYYQPQYAMADGRLVGLEALLRWNTPRNGIKTPADFVPAAEENGLIVDIEGWVLDTACAQLAAWRDQGVAPARLALNVSAQYVRQPVFVEDVRRLLARHGLRGDMLEIEVVESMLGDSVVAAALATLSREGVRVALDDFGTGHSSLSALRAHPIDVVKIDRSFLDEATPASTANTVVQSIIAMAHALGKTVVAEGVETIEQLDDLRERGCDVVQGFYLAHPLPAASITELLNGRLAAKEAQASRLAG